MIFDPTHAICRQANDTVREGLAKEGLLRGRTLAVDRLVDRRLTRVQASDLRSYEPGDGGEAEIVEIGHKRVRFRDGEREFSLALGDPQLRYLDHAYYSTVHSAQGRTARGAIAVLDAGGWVDLELFHVELSRVSEMSSKRMLRVRRSLRFCGTTSVKLVCVLVGDIVPRELFADLRREAEDLLPDRLEEVGPRRGARRGRGSILDNCTVHVPAFRRCRTAPDSGSLSSTF